MLSVILKLKWYNAVFVAPCRMGLAGMRIYPGFSLGGDLGGMFNFFCPCFITTIPHRYGGTIPLRITIELFARRSFSEGGCTTYHYAAK